ncbi:N-acetyllactosaminide beta-1,3-N-acetylglucosaminyltransferase 3 [Dromiciops gliroides]|uniref:N-acetyllactosaminide beta-1,3-N-acetylglucosaminyltransferase 3 n=1 Tax=Dromiciops gliroides TaxID=33562 RepID=UPI001CC63E91|nr:N-acetyllactosaminide beta-1,3-N-acetylglucosaminyltransferase 3 [Dromiciops gliroides]
MRRPKKACTQVLILLALAAGALFFLFHYRASELPYMTHWQEERTSEPQHQMVPEFQQQQRVQESKPQALPERPLVPCFANASALNTSGFSAQPKHIQNFLLYKHCRDFPILQKTPPNKCTGSSGAVFLLLAIKSSPKNYERRDLIRRTWGQERQVKGATICRLFLVGTEPDEQEAQKVDKLLAMEAQAHGDILQWDFHDTFFNLTLKQVLFLEWQAVHCPDASFIFNGDDDVFAHTNNMVVYLQGKEADKHLFVGHVISNVGPIRVPWSKYFVSELVMKENRYPPYCGGGGILMSRFTTRAIRRASHVIPLFPIDDVYLGMCLEREGLAPAKHIGIRLVGVKSPSSRIGSFNPCFYQDLLLVHRFLPYEMLLMWDALQKPSLECSKSVLQTSRN